MKLVGRKVALLNNKFEFGHLCISYGYLSEAEPKREHLGGTRKANKKKLLEGKRKLKAWHILCIETKIKMRDLKPMNAKMTKLKRIVHKGHLFTN